MGPFSPNPIPWELVKPFSSGPPCFKTWYNSPNDYRWAMSFFHPQLYIHRSSNDTTQVLFTSQDPILGCPNLKTVDLKPYSVPTFPQSYSFIFLRLGLVWCFLLKPSELLGRQGVSIPSQTIFNLWCDHRLDLPESLEPWILPTNIHGRRNILVLRHYHYSPLYHGFFSRIGLSFDDALQSSFANSYMDSIPLKSCCSTPLMTCYNSSLPGSSFLPTELSFHASGCQTPQQTVHRARLQPLLDLLL